MGLNYDFYKNPLVKGEKKQKLHARVVPTGTLETDAIAQLIHDTTSMSTGDVKGILTALTELMSKEMGYGYRIHLEGLGFFQLTLSCPPISNPKEIRAESIRVKSIVYRPDAEMKRKFKATRCTRIREKRHSKNYSAIQIDNILTSHFRENDYITNREFQRICSLTPSTSYSRIRQLMADGKLKRSKLHRSLYEPVTGNYGR